ncbi:hypothetical protein [Bacillus sp. AFS015802]|uniref:hypothetical protein n=1 Tax=Bacillus sp. AFS015802 TaxID=2033486 RepID=UPI0011553697|nr:hypothetical protein [Bacillus sp. AFS015802]
MLSAGLLQEAAGLSGISAGFSSKTAGLSAKSAGFIATVGRIQRQIGLDNYTNNQNHVKLPTSS